MFVQDVMTPDPVTVRTDSSVKEALTLLARYDVTSLPVVDADGRIRGVVSEADLIRESVARDTRVQEMIRKDPEVTRPRTVQEVFTPHAVTVRVRDDLAEAVDVMTSTMVKSLPVVDNDDRVVGIVSRSDVVRLLARADDVIQAELDEMLRSLGHSDWLVEVHDGVVDVTGPEESAETALARVAATTVPGVIEVRVR